MGSFPPSRRVIHNMPLFGMSQSGQRSPIPLFFQSFILQALNLALIIMHELHRIIFSLYGNGKEMRAFISGLLP